MEKLRVSVVSYLNAAPYRAGLLSDTSGLFHISDDIPSECAEKLLNGKADLGLVPVALIPELRKKGGHIVTDYCIGADGNVASVMLYSEVPLKEIKSVYLDKESRTSVMLLKLLAEKHFGIQPQWLNEDETSAISGTAARLLIGDRALLEKGKYRFETDLALSWKEYCGLPFVFACWVAMRALSEPELAHLEIAFAEGLNQRLKIAEKNASQYPSTDLKQYLLENIRYKFNGNMKKGLSLFLELMSGPEHQSFLSFSRS